MIFQQISKCPVLRDLKAERLEGLFKDIHYYIKTYDTEDLVISAGENCENLMVILEGQVRGEVPDFTGEIIKIEDIAAPRPLAPAFLFGENNKSPVSVIANEKTKVLFIPKADVLRLFQKEQIILSNFLDIISSRGQFLMQKVKLLSLKNLDQRLAYFVLKNKDLLGSKKFTQRELAELIGVTRPSVARTLTQLEKKSILDYNKGFIKIINENELRLLLKRFIE